MDVKSTCSTRIAALSVTLMMTLAALLLGPVTPAATAATVPGTTIMPADIGPVVFGKAPDGVVGQEYSFSYLVVGDPPPTTAVTAGALPDGLTLEGAALSGTPTVAGTFTFTVTATNGVNPDPDFPASVVNTITINPAPVEPSVSGQAPGGVVGQAYSFAYTVAQSAVPPSVWVSEGTLPDGLSLSLDGVLSGTPTVAGTFTFTVTNDVPQASSVQNTVVIAPATTPITPLTPSASDGDTPGTSGSGTDGTGTSGPGASGSGLAKTGGDFLGLGLAGLVLLLLGATGTLLHHRRQRTPSLSTPVTRVRD